MYIKLLILALITPPTFAADIEVAWDAPVDDRIDGYELHYGLSSSAYTEVIDIEGATTEQAAITISDGIVYLALRARNADSTEFSAFSNELLIGAISPLMMEGAEYARIYIEPPPIPLHAHWSFEEPSDTTATDVSGNGHDGIISGTTRVTGHQGNGLQFTANSDVVNVGVVPLTGDGLTIAAWVYREQGGLSDGRVVSKTTSTAEADHYYMLSTINENLRARIKAGGATITVIGGSLPRETWVHVAVTYDGAFVRLYINAVLVAESAKTGLLDQLAIDTAIGNNPMLGRSWSGMIDEVKLIDRALNVQELVDIQ